MVDGYPCKSLSPQNNNPKSILDNTSKSGAGMESLLGYVDFAHPSVVVCENVERQAHSRKTFGGEKPIEIQQKEFERRGYHGFFQVVNSKHFSLRQCRSRVYAIYVKKTEGDLLLLASNYSILISF